MATVNLTVFDDVYIDSNFADEIFAWAGDDVVRGEGGNDIIHGGLGNDRLYGGAGIDVIYGDEGSDRLYGGLNRDYLYGGEGNDYLNGEVGDDILLGTNPGSLNLFEKDFLVGGEGADSFYFTNLAGNGVSYTGGGFNDYAVISDLEGVDQIYLDAAASYTFGVTGVDGRTGVGIFKDNGFLGSDLIGLVDNTNNVAAVAAQITYI